MYCICIDCVDQQVELREYFESYITVVSSLFYITAKTVSLGCLYSECICAELDHDEQNWFPL